MASNLLLYTFAIVFIFGGIGFVFIFPNNTATNANDNLGFWGKRSSKFDWCEYNYQHSYYVAETYTTLTGSFFILLGLFQYYYYKNLIQNKAPKKLRKSLLFLIDPWLSIFEMSLGLSTMLFHCTLRFVYINLKRRYSDIIMTGMVLSYMTSYPWRIC